jgi:hypothetical protein
MNRHARRALAALSRRMQRALRVVERTSWGSPRSNDARVRFYAMQRRAQSISS